MNNYQRFLLLAFLVFGQVHAQDFFTDGYILSMQKDTISGLIENLNWRENPREIHFKPNQNSEAEVYTPADIMGFGIWTKVEEHYWGVRMDMDISTVKSTDLSYNKVRKIATVSGFMRIRILGPINLYEFRDSLKKEHFFTQKRNGDIEELIFHKYLENDNQQSTVVRTDKRYQKQLLDMMAECTAIGPEDMRHMEYNLYHISRFVRGYNDCVAPDQIQYIAKKEKPTLHLGLIAGSSYSSVSFGQGSPASLTSIEQKFTLGYLTGLGLEMQLPRNLGRNSLRFEGIYHHRRFKARWDSEENSAFSVQYLQGYLLYQHKGVVRRVNPSFGLGISIYHNLREIDLSTTSQGLFAAQYVANEGKTGAAGVIQAGFVYQNLSIDFRYHYFINSKFIVLGNGSIREQSIHAALTWFIL